MYSYSHLSKAIVIGILSILMVSSATSLSVLGPELKRVLVTGGNKGIGFAICKKLLESYPDVCVILGSRDVQLGEKAVNELTDTVGSDANGRIVMVQLDVSNDESVKAACESVCGPDGSNKLYGIVNNAGLGFGLGFEKTLQTNYVGVRRVCDAFAPCLVKPGGRIVNMASASAPNFVSACGNAELRQMLAEPLTGSVGKLDEVADSYRGMTDYENSAYGLSKALLNAYTVLHSKESPDLIINSCSPGWILTDLTSGMGASNPPEKGTVSPLHLLMSKDIESTPTGRYYGSDAVRSPLDKYRDPGTAAYDPDNA